MRKVFLFSLVLVLALALSSSVSFADKPTVKLKGKHWQFNIIGHPKNVDAIKGDDSNGRAIMVPLKNTGGPGQPVIICEEDEYVLTDDLWPTWTDQEPKGAKIHFDASDHFEIIDRDATDNDGATILVPTTLVGGEPIIAFDIWIRVLGKPNTCMDIDGYAYDAAQLTGLWFWSGSVDLNRKHGRSSWVDIKYLFDVWFCQVDPITQLCIPGTEEELSVFNNVFDDYFWNIQNNGTRLVQVRLYPKTQ